MAKIHRPRGGSGVGITSVSCSVEWLQKMRDEGISASSAFKRGLKFFFDDRLSEDTVDTLRQRCESWMHRYDLLRKENELLKWKLQKRGIE